MLFLGGTGFSFRCSQIVPRFEQYSRPRTLSSGDIGGADDGGGSDLVTNPTLARLAMALKDHMDKVYSSEVLRCLQRRVPVTLPALQNVWTCLESMPAEVTNFLVSALIPSIEGVPWGAGDVHDGGRDRCQTTPLREKIAAAANRLCDPG